MTNSFSLIQALKSCHTGLSGSVTADIEGRQYECGVSSGLCIPELMSGVEVLTSCVTRKVKPNYWLPHLRQHLEHTFALRGCVGQVGWCAMSSNIHPKGVQEAGKVILLAHGLLRLTGVGGYEATNFILIDCFQGGGARKSLVHTCYSPSGEHNRLEQLKLSGSNYKTRASKTPCGYYPVHAEPVSAVSVHRAAGTGIANYIKDKCI